MKKFVMITIAAMSMTGCANLEQHLQDVQALAVTDDMITQHCNDVSRDANGRIDTKAFMQCAEKYIDKRDAGRARLGQSPIKAESMSKMKKGVDEYLAAREEENKEKRRLQEMDNLAAKRRRQEACIVMTEARWRDKVFEAHAAGNYKEVNRLTDPAFKRRALDYCLKLN